jgi:hypothetical protein
VLRDRLAAVVGSFVVRIPVSTAEQMRIPEAITLSIMKWRLANLSPGDRWAPVLQRYIAYCSALLEGVGGDPSQVPPSLTSAIFREEVTRFSAPGRSKLT